MPEVEDVGGVHDHIPEAGDESGAEDVDGVHIDVPEVEDIDDEPESSIMW